MGEAQVADAVAKGAVGALLARLDSHALETLRSALLTAVSSVSFPPKELQAVQQLADALPIASGVEVVSLYDPLLDAIKTLCRVAIAYTSSVAASHPDESAAAFVALDDNLLPLVLAVQRFVGRLAERDLPGDPTIYSDKKLHRWVPFALTLCCFLQCRQLPGADMMQSVAAAGDMLESCVSLTRVKSQADAMAQYVGPIVSLCSQDVSKEQWTAARSLPKHAMLYAVEQVAFPHLGGDLLGRLFALIFPLVDDLVDATQLVGARLLRHVTHQVTATELRWYSDVLLEVLRPAITSRKPATLDALLDALVETLDKLSPPGELALYDRFVPRLLNDTSLCSDVVVRVVFVRHLRPVALRLGAPHSLHLIRYLQPLLKVLLAAFESVNVGLLVETLQTLRATVLGAWPRIGAHTEEIVVGVLRVVAFCELFEAGGEHTPSAEQRLELLALCEDVLLLLHEAGRPKDAVADMLRTVGRRSAQLAPFCQRVCSKASAGA